jgi:hypothetical protein
MMAAQVRIEDLHHPEGGHAQIVFTGIGGTVADWLIIRRFEHQENHLSPEGWQGPETHIAPLEVADVPGGVALTVGPDVTQWLEYGERIEIALVDTTYRAIAMWPEIGGWVGQRRSGRTAISSQARPAAPRSPPQAPVQAAGQPTIAPGLDVTVFAPRPILPPPPPLPVAPLPPAPPIAPPAGVAAGQGSARRRNTWIAAAVLLVILGAGGGYYGYTEGWWLRSDVAPTVATPPTSPPNPTTADPTPPGQVDLATLVNRPPEEVFRMAEQLYGQGSYTIAFSLFDDASRRGYGPAHTRIATFYDPATFQQDKPFQRPNPRKALEHYESAITAGDESARGPRDALVDRLRATARGNDQAAREAQTLLRELRL